MRPTRRRGLRLRASPKACRPVLSRVLSTAGIMICSPLSSSCQAALMMVRLQSGAQRVSSNE